MSGGNRKPSWSVRLSVWIYRQLLVAYPPAFRHTYSTHMVQVFRDCCREAVRADGNVGLWRYWLTATGDLVISALAERRREELQMTRTRWIQIGSLAAILGGSIAALIAGLNLIVAIAFLRDVQMRVLSPLIAFVGLSQKAGPVLWLLLAFALIGLQVRGARRAGVFGWIGIVIAMLGAFACAPNYIIVPLYLDMGSRYETVLLGTTILALGMILYGTATLWQHVLPRHNWAPLATGITELLKVATLFVGPLFNEHGDGASVFKFMAMYSTTALAFAITWILLGVAMWPREGDMAASQAIMTESAG